MFYFLSLRLKAEECSGKNKVVLFIFPDTQQQVMFHMRNGIFDFSGLYERKEDIKVTIDSVIWRKYFLVKEVIIIRLTSKNFC